MQNKNWFLDITAKIVGEDSFGEPYERSENIRIPLPATNEKDARAQAGEMIDKAINAANTIDRKFFAKYCDNYIDDEAGLSFSNLRLVSTEELDETPSIPEIFAGS